MTALNSLEVLAQFLGNNSSLGLNIEMVRKGLFEEQLKLVGQSGIGTQPGAPPKDSVPMIKKTLPIGPPVPTSPPDVSDSSQREKKDASSLAGNTPKSASASEASKKTLSESPSEEKSVSREPQEVCPADLPKSTLLEGSSSVSAEENPAVLSGNTPLGGLSGSLEEGEKPKKDISSDPTFQAGSLGQPPALGVAGSESAGPSGLSTPEQQQDATHSAPKEVPGAKGLQSGGAESQNGVLPGLASVDPADGSQELSNNLTSRNFSPTGPGNGEKKVDSTGNSIPSPILLEVSAARSSPVGIPAPISVPGATSVPGAQSSVVSASAASGSESVAGRDSGGTAAVNRVGEGGNPTASSTAQTKAKPTTNPETSSQDASIQRVRFVQRVARAFQTLRDGGGSVRLRLHPPELGSLRVELTVREGVMRARLEVENTSAQSAIVENLPTLRERLAQQDIRVEQFEVEIGGDSSGGSSEPQDHRMNEHRGASFSPVSSRSGAAETTSPSRVSPLVSSESTRLNVVI